MKTAMLYGALGGMVWLLAACGFQLRGTADLPPQMARTYLAMPDRYGEFGRALERMLAANEVVVTEDTSQATAILRINREQFVRTAASFSGTARTSEFRLTYYVDFQLQDAAGKPLSTQRHVELFRDYSFDEQEILAATREEEFLRKEMQTSMVSEVLRRLEALRIGG